MHWLLLVLRVRLATLWGKRKNEYLTSEALLQWFDKVGKKKKKIKTPSLFANTNNNHLENLFVEKTKSGETISVGKSMSFDHYHIFKAVPRY